MRKTNSELTGKKVILYDGLCVGCKTIARSINGSEKNAAFETTDFTKKPLPGNLKREDLEKEIHVVDTDGTIYKNTAALLKIMEEYPKLSLLVKLGNMPIFKQLFLLLYKYIAKNRHFLFGSSSRIFYLKIALLVGAASGFLLSHRLWAGERLYPLVPFINRLHISSGLEYILFFLAMGLLLVSIFAARPRYSIAAAVFATVILILCDQSRLQPWVYQYLFMLVALALFSWHATDKKGMHIALNICRCIVATTYIYSGLQKCNASFIYDVFPWMIEPFVRHLPPTIHAYANGFGFIVPIIELMIGVGLFSKRFRNIAVYLAILMHASILLMIGPFGRNWNEVVWPWNVCMIAFDLILFWNSKENSIRNILWPRHNVYQTAVIVLFGVMPILGLFGAWDSYMSSALYSGNTSNATLYMRNVAFNTLPVAIQKNATQSGDTHVIDISSWSFKELNVPAYPEPRVLKQVAASLCVRSKDPEGILVGISKKPLLGEPAQFLHIYTCKDIVSQ